MNRRIFAAITLGLIACSVNAQEKVLRVVPHSNLSILDPIWTTQFMARNHGYMIYDTLFGTDEKNRVQPQMVDKWTVSPDQRLWTFTLRPGLEFHDGRPVTGEDVTASIASPAAKHRSSRNRGATTWTPTGTPSASPVATESPGRPSTGNAINVEHSRQTRSVRAALSMSKPTG